MLKKKKETIRIIRKRLDKFWKRVVLRKYGNQCFVCGSKRMVDPHHFIPKRICLNLRYDIENGIPLCRKCHEKIHWKSDPFISLIIAFKKGKKWIEYLEKKKNEKIIPNKKWYLLKLEKLQKEFEEV